MTNDPKDPTTWTPEMIRRFNTYRPGAPPDEPVRDATAHPATPVTWSPDYKSDTKSDELAARLDPGCFGSAFATDKEREEREATTLAALEAVARAAGAFADCAVMADDDDGRGWYMLMLDDKGGVPKAERDALLSALQALNEAR